jgi:flagellar protein FlgJ
MIGVPDLADRLAVDVQSAQALRAGAAANNPRALRQVAQQFEAMMIRTMLKTMRATNFGGPDDPFGSSDSLQLYQDLLDQQWAQKVSEGRGLGFADMLVKQLGRSVALAGNRGGGGPASARPPPAAGTAPAESNLAEPGAQVAAVAPSNEARAGLAPAMLPTDSAPAKELDRKRRFIQAMRPYADTAARTTGIPASYILAHAALESGWGEKEITLPDGRPSHNLFGIKAGRNWDGEVAESTTTEYSHGLPVSVNQNFRAYSDYGQAFSDYASLLKHRYLAAPGAARDADGFARALSAGGYATDPAYADKLKGVIASVSRAGA